MFEYHNPQGSYNPGQPVQYQAPQQQQQQMPMGGMQGLQQIMGGGGVGGTGGGGLGGSVGNSANFMSNFGGSTGGSMGFGSTAGLEGVAGLGGETAAVTGSTQGGGMMAAAGPWAALAAVIIGNEVVASNTGRRNTGWDYAGDLAGGYVLEQDTQAFSDKVFGEDDVSGLGGDIKAIGNLGSGDFGNALQDIRGGTLGKTSDFMFGWLENVF